MTEHSALDIFVVRIYRVDPEDCRKIAGLVEIMDGSGNRVPFAGMDELEEILSQKYKKTVKNTEKEIKE